MCEKALTASSWHVVQVELSFTKVAPAKAGFTFTQSTAFPEGLAAQATDTHAVRTACTEAGLEVLSADIAWVPTLNVPLEDEVAVRVLKLVDALEDLDDVQNVWANFDVSDEVLAGIG